METSHDTQEGIIDASQWKHHMVCGKDDPSSLVQLAVGPEKEFLGQALTAEM